MTVVANPLDRAIDAALSEVKQFEVKRLVWVRASPDPRAKDGVRDAHWRNVPGGAARASSGGKRQAFDAAAINPAKVQTGELAQMRRAMRSNAPRDMDPDEWAQIRAKIDAEWANRPLTERQAADRAVRQVGRARRRQVRADRRQQAQPGQPVNDAASASRDTGQAENPANSTQAVAERDTARDAPDRIAQALNGLASMIERLDAIIAEDTRRRRSRVTRDDLIRTPATNDNPATPAASTPKRARAADTTIAPAEARGPSLAAQTANRDAETPLTAKPAGEARKVVTPDGDMEVEARPVLVELDDLIAATGDKQPRDRDRAESDAQIRKMAAALDPEQLQPGRTTDRGAPVVDENGEVLSGNGRRAAIGLAYEGHPDKAAAYRASLGPEAEGMRKPVLVMQAVGLSDEDKRKLADRSNRSAIAQMSVTERAIADVKGAAKTGVMALYRGGDFESEENIDFVRAFASSVVTAEERGDFSKDGRLSKGGEERLKAAVLASAYGDPEALSKMLESRDDNVRAITGAMLDAAPSFIALNDSIDQGAVPKRFEASQHLTEAMRIVSDLRRSNQKVRDWFDQQDAFSQVTPEIEGFIRLMYDEDLSRALSRDRIAGRLRRVAEEAAKKQDGGLFVDDTSLGDIIQTVGANGAPEGDAGLFDNAKGLGGHLRYDRQGRGQPELEHRGQEAAARGLKALVMQRMHEAQAAREMALSA